MGKKKEVQPNAGGYRTCPHCKLTFRHLEMFEQHQNLGCKKSAKSDGPTWSEHSEPGDAQE